MKQQIMTLKPLSDYIKKNHIQHALEECPECQFGQIFARDRNGRIAKGDWRRAIFSLTTGVPDEPSKILRENANDWIKHTPCIVLPKGTEFLHVTGGNVDKPENHWVSRSLVGNSSREKDQDSYSFFTSEKFGFAGQHRNDITVRMKVRLMTDLHGFFIPQYNKVHIYGWEKVQEHSVERKSTYQMTPWVPGALISSVPTGTPGQFMVTRTAARPGYEERGLATEKLTVYQPGVGGPMMRAILATWPTQLRPNFFVGASECEYVFHNRILHSVMKVTGIATSSTQFSQPKQQGRRIMSFDSIPGARGPKLNPGLPFVPRWLGASANTGRVTSLANAIKTKRTADPKLAKLFA